MTTTRLQFEQWGPGEIVGFARNGDQRSFGVTWSGGPERCQVLVSGEEAISELVATALATAPGAQQQLTARLEALSRENSSLRARLPHPELARLLGDGCVREDRQGKGLWLLACPEKGWSAFGVRLDGWDDLFRRYDVVIDAPQVDADGQWWPARPRRSATT